jgi:thioredoxin reductase (NADPH)
MPECGPPRSFDLLVVGLGPAGVACALQAWRDGLRVAAIGDEPIGGLVAAARRVDNLPGLPGVPGSELARALAAQLDRTDAVVLRGRVDRIDPDGAGFVATLAEGSRWSARAVCLALGTRPRAFPGGLPAGACRDVRSLPSAPAGGRAVVIGGGEAALDTALTLVDRGAAVALLARGDSLRGAGRLRDEIRASAVDVRLGCAVDAVLRGPDGFEVRTPHGAFRADDLLACVGRDPSPLPAGGVADAWPHPDAVSGPMPGVFAAGDLIRGRDRYVATAFGDGQRAAVAAARYVASLRSGEEESS